VRAIVRYGVDRAEGGNPYVAKAIVPTDRSIGRKRSAQRAAQRSQTA
jgi:hypothetical protein